MPGDWDDPDEDDTGWPADDQPETAWAPTQYDEPMHEERWVPGGDWDPQPPVAEYEPPAPDTTPVPSVPVWVNVSNPAGSITVQASTGGRIDASRSPPRSPGCRNLNSRNKFWPPPNWPT